MKRGLSLYVWEDVLCDWTCGIVFALATSVEEARKLVLAVDKHYSSTLEKAIAGEPSVHTDKVAFYVWGGS